MTTIQTEDQLIDFTEDCSKPFASDPGVSENGSTPKTFTLPQREKMEPSSKCSLSVASSRLPFQCWCQY